MRRAGTIVWREIEDALERDLADGVFAPGTKMPVENDLAAKFGVNRHTVRRALASLKERGLISIEPGRGVFAKGPVLSYPVSRRTRFSESIGHISKFIRGEMLRSWHLAAPEKISVDLDLPVGSSLVAIDDLRTVDGHPLSLGTHYFPLPRFADLPVLFAETRSVTKALSMLGVDDYERRLTRVHARGATPDEASTLHCDSGSPVLVVESVNVDLDGKPIEFGYSRSVGEVLEMVFDNRNR
jgi:GntR family transcriptional regulator, phosphonate transport system regulatory protein